MVHWTYRDATPTSEASDALVRRARAGTAFTGPSGINVRGRSIVISSDPLWVKYLTKNRTGHQIVGKLRSDVFARRAQIIDT